MAKTYFLSATGFKRWVVSGLLVAIGCSGPSYGATAATKYNGERWIDIWGSMPQLVEPGNLPPAPFNAGDSVFRNATLRQTVYITQDASTIRLQFSNAFGSSDLPITAATVALPLTNNTSSGAGTSAIRPSTLQTITFSGGLPSFTIPNGALAISDPLPFPVKSQSVLTITLHLAAGQPGQSITGHPGSRTTSFLAPGNHVFTPDLSPLPGSAKTDHWYFLSTIQGWLPPPSTALSIIGDSITDGRGSTTNLNNRWPDRLLARLQSSKSPLSHLLSHISIINQAAGGNRLLADGLGPNALGRIERDVLAHVPSTTYVIVYIGVNDLGTADIASVADTGERLIAGYKQIITRLHGAGIAVFGATITPMSGEGQAYSAPERERVRGLVNAWIRGGKDGGGGKKKGGGGGIRGEVRFDGVIDFDAVVRDPRNGTQLDPRYDVGDYLHLNPDGYEAMAAAVDLELFERFRDGVVGVMV